MMSHGVIFVTSLAWLVMVICVVYSIAQAPHAPVQAVFRHSFRRLAKLGGLLAVLAVVINLMSR